MDNETRENISNFLREYKRAMQEFQDSPEAKAIVQTLKAVNDFNTQLAISIEKSGLLEVIRDFSASLEKIRPALEYLSQYEPALYEQVDDVLAQVEPDEIAEPQKHADPAPKISYDILFMMVEGLGTSCGLAPEEYKLSLWILYNIIFSILIAKVLSKAI